MGRRWRLPLLSGLLLALSFPPLPTTPLPFVALVPLGVHLGKLSGDREGERRAWLGGARMGAVLFALLLHWIPLALPWWLGVPAWLLAVALLSLAPALAAGATHRALHRHRLPLWVGLPLAWTGAEWLRAHLPLGLAFPWLGTAAALAGLPDALVLAEWAGERGVTLQVALVNALVAEGVLRARREGGGTLGGSPPGSAGLAAGVSANLSAGRSAGPSAPWAPLVAAVVITLVPLVAGRARAGSLAAGPVVRVALLRTELRRTGREDPATAAREMVEALARTLPTLAPGAADLVVLPETAFPMDLEGEAGRPWREALASHAARLGAPLVVGGLALDEGGSAHNSVFLVDGGGIRGRYDKRHLVPGVENVPLLPSPFLRALGDSASFEAGRARPPLGGGGLLLGALVCYESAFGDLAREHGAAGADLLVNVTNDAWFGRLGGAARAQHEAHLVLRAVEGRVGVARAANGGASLVVDPSGRVTVGRRRGEGVDVLEVRARGGTTLFVRLGDVVGPLAAALALLALLPASWTPWRPAARPCSTAGRSWIVCCLQIIPWVEARQRTSGQG